MLEARGSGILSSKGADRFDCRTGGRDEAAAEQERQRIPGMMQEKCLGGSSVAVDGKEMLHSGSKSSTRTHIRREIARSSRRKKHSRRQSQASTDSLTLVRTLAAARAHKKSIAFFLCLPHSLPPSLSLALTCRRIEFSSLFHLSSSPFS